MRKKYYLAYVFTTEYICSQSTHITMNIILIGASGFVGKALLNEALSRSHKVTAVIRDPSKITLIHNNLTVVKSDVSDTEALISIAKGKDAVISAYNPGWTNPNIYEDTQNNYNSILAAAKRSGVKRLLCVGGAGTLFVKPGVRVMDAANFTNPILADGIKSLGKFYLETLTNEKEIDWVFFSPASNISPGERTGKFRLGKDDLVVDADGNSKISVEDYAVAMIDELEKPAHHQERFTIGY